MMPYEIISHSIEETMAIGQTIGSLLEPGDVIGLTGALGAGKTWLVKGMAKGLGVTEWVNSPAFDLVHEYQGNLPIYHMDFYRLDILSNEDILWLRTYFDNPTSICIVEWSEKFISNFSDQYVTITMAYLDTPEKRKITLNSVNQACQRLMFQFNKPL